MEDLVYLEGYDDAILGIGNRYPFDNLVIYSKRKIIEILQEQGLEFIDALELFDETIGSMDLGDGTPIICDDFKIIPGARYSRDQEDL